MKPAVALPKVLLAGLLASVSLLTLSCGGGEAAPDAEAPAPTGPLTVYTVNYPLFYMAERIGGDMATVHFPAPPGIDPAHWSPGAEEIGGFQEADLVLLSGAGFAQLTETAALPRARLVDTSYDFPRPFIMRDQALTHSHGPQGMHSHKEMASTVWLDLGQAISQAEYIAKTFATARPDHAADFESRLAAVRDELAAIDAEMVALLEPHHGNEILASHPLYDYFARQHRLDLVTFTWEPHEAPTEEMWADLDLVLENSEATWMVWDGEPLAETREQLAARDIVPIVVDPCANRPDEGDFLSVMRANLENLRAALAE